MCKHGVALFCLVNNLLYSDDLLPIHALFATCKQTRAQYMHAQKTGSPPCAPNQKLQIMQHESATPPATPPPACQPPAAKTPSLLISPSYTAGISNKVHTPPQMKPFCRKTINKKLVFETLCPLLMTSTKRARENVIARRGTHNKMHLSRMCLCGVFGRNANAPH
jgi:hypothetical protein